MILHLMRLSMVMCLLATTTLWALAKTGGTPLGGMGTGYVSYDARKGVIAASGKDSPPASERAADKPSSSSGFHFFAGGSSTLQAKTDNEDSKIPVYTADFGKTGNVVFTLTAFGPYVPGDGELIAKLAQSPLAYFEISAKNTGSSAIEAAVAMEFSNKATSGANLLGGSNTGTGDANNRALTYAGSAQQGNAYLIDTCTGKSVTYTAGSRGSFSSTGLLKNGAGNLVAAKCSIPAGETVKFRFVLAWWRQFISSVDRYGTGKPDSDNYFYHNFYDDSKEAAHFGLKHFEYVRTGATSIVNRTMASNFPDWYKDRLLNNLYPLIHNSVTAKDGRVAFWEGRYPIIGTIDQGQHANVWYAFNQPSIQWREFQYWARTSHTGKPGPTGPNNMVEKPEWAGQIHHDFNRAPGGNFTADAKFLCPWDDYTRKDYSYQATTTVKWSDLNSMFIFKAYELMMATGDRDSVVKYWPYVKRTADRILVQCREAGANSHLPLKSLSTYDTGREMTPTYASSTALAAFLCVREMAKYLGDEEYEKKYDDWYKAARPEFVSKLFKSTFCTNNSKAEGDIAGYSWARYFCLPAIMDSNVVATGCDRLNQYYSSASSIKNKLGLWHFYTYDHWGGAAIAIGQQDVAMKVHKWDYDRYHAGAPEYVHWQDLSTATNKYYSYMTAPNVWRSHFQMTGYMMDRANDILWIRPMVPTEMGKKIENAPLPNPKGWGTLNYDENVSDSRYQKITVAFDNPLTVKTIMLKNNTDVSTPGVKVLLNGARIKGATVKAEGSGFEKNIRVSLEEPIQIGSKGITIEVYNAPVGIHRSGAMNHGGMLAVTTTNIGPGKSIRYNVPADGVVSMELIGMNGQMIGRIMNQSVFAGSHRFVWNGASLSGTPIGMGMAVLRLVTENGVAAQKVFINR